MLSEVSQFCLVVLSNRYWVLLLANARLFLDLYGTGMKLRISELRYCIDESAFLIPIKLHSACTAIILAMNCTIIARSNR